MSHTLHARPSNEPDAEPMRLLIEPGSASAEEIAKVLAAISELSVLMGGQPIKWTSPKKEP